MELEIAVKEVRERITRDVLGLLSGQGKLLRGAKIEWLVESLTDEQGYCKLQVRTSLNSVDLRLRMEDILLAEAEYHMVILPRLREKIEDLAFLEGRTNLQFGVGTAVR